MSSVDLGTIPTNADLTVLDTIPLNTDYTPYQDLQAQGRYGQLLMPDNLPALLSMLYGPRSDGNPNGQLCSFDGKHNLNVNVAAGGGGGLSPLTIGTQTTSYDGIPAPSGAQTQITGYSNITLPTLIGVCCTVWIPPASTPSALPGIYEIGVAWGNGTIRLAMPTLTDPTTKIYGMETAYTYAAPFPIPINWLATGATNNPPNVYVKSSNIDAAASAYCIFGP